MSSTGPAAERGNGREQFGRLDRLCDMRDKARPEGTDPVFGARERRQSDGWQPRAITTFSGPDHPQQFVSVDFRHPDIAHENIRRFELDHLQSFCRRSGGPDLCRAIAKQTCHEFAGILLVVDHQNLDAGQIDMLERDHRRRRSLRMQPLLRAATRRTAVSGR